jgi:hypothetical protein
MTNFGKFYNKIKVYMYIDYIIINNLYFNKWIYVMIIINIYIEHFC